MDVVQVKWRDSVTLQGWRFAEEMTKWKGEIITSNGYIVSETKDDVIMAMSKGRNGDFCNWLSIPANMIISRRVLK